MFAEVYLERYSTLEFYREVIIACSREEFYAEIKRLNEQREHSFNKSLR